MYLHRVYFGLNFRSEVPIPGTPSRYVVEILKVHGLFWNQDWGLPGFNPGVIF